MMSSLKTQTFSKVNNQPELFNSGEIGSGWKSFSAGLLEIRTAKTIPFSEKRNLILTKALRHFSECLSRMPDYELAHGYLGEALFFLGKYKLAFNSFNKAITLCGVHKYPALYFFRGCSALKLGKYKCAVSDFNKTIEISPEYLEAFYHRGIAQYKMRKYNYAIRDFQRTIEICINLSHRNIQTNVELYPENSKVLEYLASCYFNLEQFEKALECYSKLIENNFNIHESYQRRGLCYYNLHLLNESEYDFKKAIEADEYDHESYFYRANIHAINEEYEKAISDYSKSISLYLNNTKALLKRASVYMQICNLDYAIRDLHAAREISPDSSVIYYNLGIVFLKMGLDDKSIENFRIASKLGHNKATAWLKNHNIY